MKQLKGIYVFREITNARELLSAFELRYQTYSASSGLQQLIQPNQAKLDIDGFDAYARHYGIFAKGQMIGYMRVIWHQEPPVMKSVVEKICTEKRLALPGHPGRFYAQEKFAFPDLWDQLPRDNPSISFCEPGRFIILPAYRSAGLAQFAIESIMVVICAQSPHPIGIIDCRQRHRYMYERNGFTWLAEETTPDLVDNTWNLLMISAEGVAKQIPDLPARIRSYQNRGQFEHQLGQIDWIAFSYLPVLMRRWRKKFITNFRPSKRTANQYAVKEILQSVNPQSL